MSCSDSSDDAEHPYAPYYCEENAILLAQRLRARGCSDVLLVFVSNPRKAVPLWCMRNGNANQGGFICFDYHALALARESDASEWRVFDLDFASRDAGDGVAFDRYVRSVLRGAMQAPYERLFRVVTLDDVEREFRSDRSHMVDSAADPPPWPVL